MTLSSSSRNTSFTVLNKLAEIIPNLIDFFGNDINSVISACNLLTGSFAIACINKNNPEKIYAAKRNSPLFIARTNGGIMCASDCYCFEKNSVYYELKTSVQKIPHLYNFSSHQKFLSHKMQIQIY